MQGLPVNPVELLMGSACVSEACVPFLESLNSNLCSSGLSVATSAIVLWFPC